MGKVGVTHLENGCSATCLHPSVGPAAHHEEDCKKVQTNNTSEEQTTPVLYPGKKGCDMSWEAGSVIYTYGQTGSAVKNGDTLCGSHSWGYTVETAPLLGLKGGERATFGAVESAPLLGLQHVLSHLLPHRPRAPPLGGAETRRDLGGQIRPTPCVYPLYGGD